MKSRKFSWRARARSFRYAFRGWKLLVNSEHNAWLHLSAASLAILLGALLDISSPEWIAVVICIGAVLGFEALNSAVEALADKVSPEFDPLIRDAKDLAAGAVMFVAAAALVTGLLIFLPKIIAVI